MIQLAKIKYRSESSGQFVDITPDMIDAAEANVKYLAQSAIDLAGLIAQTCKCCSPIVQQVKSIFSNLANAMDAFIYYDGTIYCPSSKASVANSTITFSDSCSASDSMIILE